jgi:PAS domain S-box-containing protein
MPSGIIVQMNAGFTELTQYQPSEIIGKRTSEFGLWANLEKEIERQKTPGYTREYHNYESTIICKDGSERIVFITAKQILLNNEANLLIAFSDITEMRASEARERQQELLTKTIFDTAPFGIWARDPERKLVIENKYVIDLYGSHLTETLAQADNPNLPLKHWMQLDEAAFRGEYSEYEEEVILPNGERFFAQKITTPMRQDGEIKGIMGFVIDITARKMIEIELEKEREELKRSNADLEQFAYVASHDLQEPLRMVSSYLQLIERRYKGKLDAKGDEFIAFAVDGASTMQRQILDLLMYSRVGLRTPENAECESQHALDTALTHLKFRIEETQAVITHDALPKVMADETQLTQVFQNLVGNAIKFVEGKPPLVQIACQAEPEFWHFTVKDNGIGLEPRYTDRIFVIFQRLHEKNTYPGTGIGLAICKKIINRSGGKIWVESEVGVGSTFHFTLPRKAVTNNE